MITLPDEIQPAINDIQANNILIVGDYGMGKSGLLASTGYLILNPESENKIRQYPCLPVHLKTWNDHKDVVKELAKIESGKYPGIGLDSLNISYDQCLSWVMKNVTFQGAKLTHPSENPQIAYPRVTHEFITWLRDITMLGYHIIATCHANVSEVKAAGVVTYNRWIPAFTGGSPTSTYAGILKIFSIVGFMTMEDVVKPSTRQIMGKPVVDARADAARIETSERRVIHFNQSKHWLANNKHNGFPGTVILPENWEDDWKTLQESWGQEGNKLAEEPIQTGGLKKVGGGK